MRYDPTLEVPEDTDTEYQLSGQLNDYLATHEDTSELSFSQALD